MVPEGWRITTISDIAKSIVPGRNKPKSFTGDIPWITMPKMKGRFVPSQSHDLFLSKQELYEASGKLVPTNSVIMSCVGELGIVTRNVMPVVLNQQLHAFVPNNDTDPAFLALQLENSRAEMLARASKTTIPYLNKSNCEALPILLPPLPEQKKIAEILSTWDKAIETTEKLLANAEAQKRALMQQLLTGKRRLKGFEGSEWKRSYLKDIASITLGSSPPSSAYNDNKTGLPLLQGNADIKNGISHPRSYTTDITQTCLPGDSLLSVRAPVGSIARSQHTACIGRGLAAIRAKDPDQQQWLHELLIWITPKWQKYSQGSTFEAINGADIKNLSIFAPSSELERIAIGDTLCVMSNSIRLIKYNIASIQAQKRALMQQLLTGKRRVTV